jgi:hypothetical protein
LAATLAIAAIGAYLLWSHTGHALAAAPYLLLLACPLLHLFGHRHGHSHDRHSSQSQSEGKPCTD